MLSLLVSRALDGQRVERTDVDFLIDYPDLEALIEAAHHVTQSCASPVFNVCTIINAKAGRCSENCRWCAQSKHYPTHVAATPMVNVDRGLDAEARARANDIHRLSNVTAGRKLSRNEMRALMPVIEATSKGDVDICASLGLMTEEELRTLKASGLTRYHCNLETGRNFFPKVCTSHTYDDKCRTIEAARRAGLDLCSGGLFGMGETMADRLDLACDLARLGIGSIPMNFLHPIPGTPLEAMPPLTDDEVLRTITAFRLINPKACLRFAGGRMRLSDSVVRRALHAGINGAIVGDLLTTAGSTVANERHLAVEAGYRIR